MADWITTAEAAKISRYHPVYLRDLIRAKKIKAKKFATVWQIDRVSLLAYLRKAEKLGKKRGRKTSN